MFRDHSDQVQILSLKNGYSVLQASYERLKDRSCWRCRSRENWLVSRAKELYATLHDYYSLMKEPFDYDLVYSPTVFETCFSNIDTTQLGNYQTNIWDTGGCAILDWQRPLAYIRADVFMLCFDVSNRESFCSVTERWLPELRKYEPDTPVLIVGTKADLRDQTAR